ncbi:MAG: hypothetical protein HYV07_20005 [Deltaproteobacteria bacterium]|nr:hypothetical protein [Deltaproteobacteria bacterium]
MTSRSAVRWTVLILVSARTASATTLGAAGDLAVSPAGAEQRAPAIAFDGTRYLVAFEENLGAGVELVFVRVDAAGALLDPAPLALAAAPGNASELALALAPNGAVLAAWTDPRDGVPDEIYVAAIDPVSGAVDPPNGRRLTTNTSDEAAPAIACGASNCLVAYTAVASGRTRLMGQRVGFDGAPIDPSETDLVPLDAARKADPAITPLGSGFLVAFEDDRAGPAGDLYAELYGRLVPSTGTITSTGGIRLVSGPFRQSSVQAVTVGGSEALLVWQDQRDAAASGLELWAQSVDSELRARGPAQPILSGPNDQLFPKVALGIASGIVIAEDFRFGPIGQIVGAQIELDGRPTGSTFVVLDASATLFEQAVAKGPGADYLVAAVRTGAPSRIVLRLVRDEAPAGTLTAASTPAAADGVAAASLDFATARGPSGLVVADGTLFTIGLSRNDVTLLNGDVDARPGVQTIASSGVVHVELTSTEPGPVEVSIASVEGTCAGSVTQAFENVAPRISNVRISPVNPGSDDELSLDYDYFDVNGDPESGTTIRWSTPALQPMFDDQRTIPASATDRGETWRAQLVPRDGALSGSLVFSPSVTIGNGAPAASTLRIRPDTGVVAGTSLTASYGFFDPDGDLESGSRIGWSDRGARQSDLEGARTIPGARVVKGQVWRFEVEPSDGTAFGELVGSATITVGNSAPIASAGSDLVVTERRRFVLDGSSSSDIDGDRLEVRFTQRAGPTLPVPSSSSATVGLEAPSVTGTTVLVFELTVSDGEATVEDTINVEVQPVPDLDSDGLDDEEEALHGTRVDAADSDRDGLRDGEEVANGLAPLDADSDDDGARDGAEPSPLEDLDGDTKIGALDPDSDGDGIFDGTELGVTEPVEGTDVGVGAFVADADRTTTTSATSPDTDGDGIFDGREDADRNGRLDPGESDPNDRTSVEGCFDPSDACANGAVCRDGACRAPLDDAGLTCQPLATRRLECCVGSCKGGAPRAPRCETAGALEVCGADAITCTLGACSVEAPPPAKVEGCGCRNAGGAGSQGAAWLAFIGMALTLRRMCRVQA